MLSMDKIQQDEIYGLQKVLQKNVYDLTSKAKQPVKKCLCQCILCGKKSYRQPCNLLNGKESSCRCRTNVATAERNKKNSSVKIGNRYGWLEVTEDLGYRFQSRGKRQSWYKCICHHCGNTEYEVNGNNLQSGNTTSCGCVISQGEELIKQILKINNYNFSTQYNFKDLVGDGGRPLRFDIAVFKENQLAYLIEFDGRQHFTGPEAKWKNSYSLEQQRQRDIQKNNYCKEHSIILKRIPYWQKDLITITNIESDLFNVV